MFNNIFQAPDTEISFITTHLKNQSASQYFSHEKFVTFLSLVNDREAAAAKEYQNVTDAKLSECIFAIKIAKKLFPAG